MRRNEMNLKGRYLVPSIALLALFLLLGLGAMTRNSSIQLRSQVSSAVASPTVLQVPKGVSDSPSEEPITPHPKPGESGLPTPFPTAILPPMTPVPVNSDPDFD